MGVVGVICRANYLELTVTFSTNLLVKVCRIRGGRTYPPPVGGVGVGVCRVGVGL